MLLYVLFLFFFFFKQKTAYEMRISDWSSDVCSSDLKHAAILAARNLTPDSCAALRRQLAVLYETADTNDPARQVEEDYRFHRLICEISGNRRLLKLFDDLAYEMRLVIGLIGRLYDDKIGRASGRERVGQEVEISG